MVSVQNITKKFGANRAVDNISFEVTPGTILGFLGPNGAGKSTTMKMLTGFLTPTSGTASVNGYDIIKDPIKAKSLIGYLPESSPAYQEMTVLEFLKFIADCRGFTDLEKKSARLEEVISLCNLEGVRNQTIETLSKGYKQRVGFAQAIFHDPPILILDEPTDGLDPNQKHEVRKIISSMAKDKVIILSTHILEEVDALCNRIIIINHGRVIIDQTPDEIHNEHGHKLDEVFRKLTSSPHDS
jgi:ABC-2 type transport system ATP-binding protein